MFTTLNHTRFKFLFKKERFKALTTYKLTVFYIVQINILAFLLALVACTRGRVFSIQFAFNF